MRISALSYALFVLAIAGCDRNEEIKVYRVVTDDGQTAPAKAPADPHAGVPMGTAPGGDLPPGHPPTGLPPGHPPTTAGGGGGGAPPPAAVSGETPEHWEAGRASSMRLASFLAKGAAGESADISLVILGGAAGGILDNVNRWRSQLGQAPLDEAGLEQTTERLETKIGEAVVVDVTGLGEGADPLTDGRTVAAIVEQPDETWFFKMRGNAELVGGERQGFLDWVASVEPKGDAATGNATTATTPAPAPPAPASGRPAVGEQDGVRWIVPAEWTEAPAKPMRVVTYQAGGEGAEATIAKLGGDGGGTLANLNRWRQQVGLAPAGSEELAGMITPLEAGGPEMSMSDLAGATDRILVAWMLHDGATWYFKLTGPVPAVEAQREAFDAFLKSVSLTEE